MLMAYAVVNVLSEKKRYTVLSDGSRMDLVTVSDSNLMYICYRNSTFHCLQVFSYLCG